jgi:hypothetical protein
MSRKLATPVSFPKAVNLCLLALFRPAKFLELQQADNATLNASPSAPEIETVRLVRAALLNSLVLVLAAGAFGALVGCLLRCSLGSATPQAVSLLQAIGALVLLWATLAVRGWDVLTFVGVSYTERVNSWIYRFVYCLGTSIIVCSLIWQIPAAG